MTTILLRNLWQEVTDKSRFLMGSYDQQFFSLLERSRRFYYFLSSLSMYLHYQQSGWGSSTISRRQKYAI
ncbi:MAG: hypothetical protein ACFB0E_08040 [Leptolyngbyaceae cyanobacterium]